MVIKMIEHTGKIDLACGDNKREGFFGIDKFKTDSTDAEVDLLSFPWPIESDSVEEVNCSHFLEHVPKELRPKFMEELYRVMKKHGKATFTTPMHDRCYQDFTHEWPPVVAGSYLYFNKQWREQNKLMHGAYDIKCDFDFAYGFGLPPEIASRNMEYQQFAIQHYNNSTTDLIVTLTKKE